jgi:hypothetical protein
MFAVLEKVKPDIENIRGLNLVVVKLMTVQVTRQPLQHKICKIGMFWSAKPVLTEDLCVLQKKEFFNSMLYVRNAHLTKGQAYSLETNPSSRQRGCYVRTNTARVHLGEKSLVVSLKGLDAKTN